MFISSRNLSFAIVLVTMVSSGTVFAEDESNSKFKSKSGSSKSEKKPSFVSESGSSKSKKKSSFVSVDYWAVVEKEDFYENVEIAGFHILPLGGGDRRLSVDRGTQNVDSQSGKRRGVRGVSSARHSLRSGEKTDASRPRQLEPAPDEAGINIIGGPSVRGTEVGSERIVIANLYEDVDYDGDKNIDKLELVGGGDGIVSRGPKPIGSFNEECKVIDFESRYIKARCPVLTCKTGVAGLGKVCLCGDDQFYGEDQDPLPVLPKPKPVPPPPKPCDGPVIYLCQGKGTKDCEEICLPQDLYVAPGCTAFCSGLDFSTCETLCPNTATFNCDITMCPDDHHCVHAVHETSIDFALAVRRRAEADADAYKVKVGPVNTIAIKAPITGGTGRFLGAVGQVTMKRIFDFQPGNIIEYGPAEAGEAELKEEAARMEKCNRCIVNGKWACCPYKFKVTLEYIPMDQKQLDYFSNTE